MKEIDNTYKQARKLEIVYSSIFVQVMEQTKEIF